MFSYILFLEILADRRIKNIGTLKNDAQILKVLRVKVAPFTRVQNQILTPSNLFFSIIAN